MKAAVVTDYGRAPEYGEVAAPAAGEGELVVDVAAAGLHPRVRSQADGSHYTATGVLPFVPGIDGVGRDADGTLRYFLLETDVAHGSMAQRTVIEARRSVVLPAGADPVSVAAAMNPAMSSWVALRKRVAFEPGMSVLVLGATGNAGSMAVKVARLFGASTVVVAARNADALTALTAPAALPGVTDTVVLGRADTAERLAATAGGVDVVLDYLWGEPTADALRAIVPARPDASQPLWWVQIGAVAGATSPIPSAALRSSKLQLLGSGQGSVGGREYAAELPGLAEAITRGDLSVSVRAVPLAEVHAAWTQPDDTGERIVLVP